MFEWIADPQAWIALATLTALEIVLGIDNIIFLSIVVGRLPVEQRQLGRILGLAGAMITRILLLISLAWIMKLTQPLFTVFTEEISGRDIILIVGGLFLLFKSTHEIHTALEGEEETSDTAIKGGFFAIIVQIAIIDIVFSLDSVITAVGLVKYVSVMAIAIILAVGVMMLGAKPIGDFVDAHPTIKILALSFLILIGVTLMVEGFNIHVPKGYIYFAMAFSVVVEMLNIRMRKKQASPVKLHKQVQH